MSISVCNTCVRLFVPLKKQAGRNCISSHNWAKKEWEYTVAPLVRCKFMKFSSSFHAAVAACTYVQLFYAWNQITIPHAAPKSPEGQFHYFINDQRGKKANPTAKVATTIASWNSGVQKYNPHNFMKGTRRWRQPLNLLALPAATCVPV